MKLDTKKLKKAPKKAAAPKKAKEIDVDQAVKAIHASSGLFVLPKEPVIRITIDMPETLHTDVKRHIAGKGNMKNYVLDLIKKDLAV